MRTQVRTGARPVARRAMSSQRPLTAWSICRQRTRKRRATVAMAIGAPQYRAGMHQAYRLPIRLFLRPSCRLSRTDRSFARPAMMSSISASIHCRTMRCRTRGSFAIEPLGNRVTTATSATSHPGSRDSTLIQEWPDLRRDRRANSAIQASLIPTRRGSSLWHSTWSRT